jgi:GT2 family glycosyltransferase
VKLSIIIVNYNVRYYLEQAVGAALLAMDGLEAELIVVDNASTDGSDQMMATRFPTVNYIYSKENTGFSRGNNMGMRIAKGEYLLLLNPDTVVAEDAFKRAVDRMDKDESIGGLGVHMVDGTGNFLPESKRGLPTPKAAFYKVFGLSSLFPGSKRFGSYHLSYLDKEKEHEVEILSGAFMMMRRSALDKAGLLDEDFFMYGEDIDLSYRLIKAGYRNLYFPDSRIIHYKGESTKKGSVNYVFVFYRAMIIFAKKHFEKGQASLFGVLINSAIYFRAFLAIVRRLFGRIWQALLDGVIALIAFYLSTQWYADFAEKNFELPFVSASIIGYSVVIAFVLLYANVYDKNYRPARLIRGWSIAVLVLLGVYALLPESYRFSRAVVLIGSGISLAGGLTWRALLPSLIGSKRDGVSTQGAQRILVIGEEESLEQVKAFLSAHELEPQFAAGITPDERKVYPLGFITSADRLEQALKEFQVDQVIFDTNVLSNKRLIGLMEVCSDWDVDLKMTTGDPMYLIGGSEVIAEKETLKVGDLKRLNVQSIRRMKRTIDLLLWPLLFVASPFLMMLADDRLGFWRNLWDLLFGNCTLVSTDPRGRHPLLPTFKRGILHPHINVIMPDGSEQQVIQQNLSYLKHYSALNDLSLCMRHLHALGHRPVESN